MCSFITELELTCSVGDVNHLICTQEILMQWVKELWMFGEMDYQMEEHVFLLTCDKLNDSELDICGSNKIGGGFGNQSYLMVHLLTLATCWFDVRQKQRLFLFRLYLQIEDVFFMCTANYVLV